MVSTIQRWVWALLQRTSPPSSSLCLFSPLEPALQWGGLSPTPALAPGVGAGLGGRVPRWAPGTLTGCVFSSRSGSRDVSGRRKYGSGYLHPCPHHLLTAGRSLHLHHQVRRGSRWAWGLSTPSTTSKLRSPRQEESLLSPRPPLSRCRYYSNLRLPLMYSHPYSQITVETEFDNPIYETGVSQSPFSPRDLPLCSELADIKTRGLISFCSPCRWQKGMASGSPPTGPLLR